MDKEEAMKIRGEVPRRMGKGEEREEEPVRI